MKKIRMIIVVLLVMLMPMYSVKAIDLLTFMPDKIMTDEGFEFERNGDVYSLAVDSVTNVLHLQLDFPGYTYEGNNVIFPGPGSNISYIKVFAPSDEVEVCDFATCDYQVLKFVVHGADGEDSSYLKSLKVVGGKINYKEDVLSYSVTVPSGLEETYIEAIPYSDSSTVEGGGTIKLNGSKTVVKVVNHNGLLGDVTYTITIKKSVTNYLIIGALVVVIIALLIFMFIKNKKSRVTVKVNDLNGIDGLTKGEIVNTKNVIKEVNEEEATEVKEETSVEESTPVEAAPAPVAPQTPVVKAAPVAEEPPVVEETPVAETTTAEEPIINNAIQAGGIAPRTMIVPDSNE